MIRRFLHGRAVAALAGTILAATMSAAASGAPPERFPDASISVACEVETTSGDDTAILYIASVNDAFGAGAAFDIWADGADLSGPPTHTSDFNVPGTGSASPTGLTVEQAIVAVDSGDPAGTAVITATFEAVGRPQRIHDLFHFGNTFERITGTIQELAITSGSMTALGQTYDLSACIAWATDATVMRSMPDAFLINDAGFTMNCGWPEGEPTRFLFAEDFGDGGFVDVFFEDLLIGGGTQTNVSPRGISVEFALFDFNTSEEYTASLEASFEPLGDAAIQLLEFQGGRAKLVSQRYEVSGSFTVADLGIELDLSGCFAEEFRYQEISTSPSGPKGKPLANDAPEGAMTLHRGATSRLITGATDTEAEIVASCLNDPENGEFFGKTVWYAIEGDGGEVTIDTAGSDFDTALAVYEVDGEDLVEIACVDDVPTGEFTRTLQAAATWDTDAGTTYLVQVGGWAYQSGRLVVSVD